MPDINLKQLEAFVATVEYSSFTRAAEKLFLTQSTVSSHISALENQLNMRLIHRGARRRVELTAEGKPVYDAARDILRRCQKLQNMAVSPETQPLAVGASSVPGQYLLPDIMSGFLRENRASRYTLTRGDSALIHKMLDEDQIRIGFAGAALDTKRYHYHPLTEDRLVLITPNTPEFRSKRAAGVSGTQLLDLPMICREPSSGTRRATEDYLRTQGIDPESLHVVAQIDSPEAVKSSVIRGLGISVVSELSIREELDGEQLLAFDLDSRGVYRSIYLLYRKDLQPTHPEKLFIDFVVRMFSDQ